MVKQSDKAYSFFMPMEIPTVTHQQKRVNMQTGHFYEGQKLKSAREFIMLSLLPFTPIERLEPPLKLKVVWNYSTKDNKKLGKYKVTRPDLDNHQKLLQDCMTQMGFWRDDSEIACLTMIKRYDSKPGILVEIETLEECAEE